MSKIIKLNKNYQDVLKEDSCQEDWADNPEFPKEDYKEYRKWLTDLISVNSLNLDLKTAVFIGANKIFRSFLYTTERDNKNKPKPMGLMIENGTFFGIQLPLDYENNVSYKNLYVQRKLENPIAIRSISSRGIDYYPLKIIFPSGKAKDLIANKTTLERLLTNFQEFHKFMK